MKPMQLRVNDILKWAPLVVKFRLGIFEQFLGSLGRGKLRDGCLDADNEARIECITPTCEGSPPPVMPGV